MPNCTRFASSVGLCRQGSSTAITDPRGGASARDLIATRELTGRGKEAAPEIRDAFQAFTRRVFADAALPEKTKQFMAVAVTHITQCPYCIRGHARLSQRREASEQETIEAIWAAADMRAGGAYAHSVIALDALAAEDGEK